MMGVLPVEEEEVAGAGCRPRACNPAAMRSESIRTLPQLTWAAVDVGQGTEKAGYWVPT